jgi:hypothetical protein
LKSKEIEREDLQMEKVNKSINKTAIFTKENGGKANVKDLEYYIPIVSVIQVVGKMIRYFSFKDNYEQRKAQIMCM